MLNRFALVKAQAKEYVRQSQTRMILQPVVDRLVAELGTAGLAARVQAILAGLRERAPRAPGYAGGNLLNLLLHAGIDVAGYDFSRLSVWQADLQGLVGAGVNFRRSRSDRLHLYADHVPGGGHVWRGRTAAGRGFD